MSNDPWLLSLLAQQDLSQYQLNSLQSYRQQVENQLTRLSGQPRFYYAGSYGKKTLIKQRYDLDIVIYWPSTTSYTLENIYSSVGNELQRHWVGVKSKTVSWEIPFGSDFHIDVVPGRALDSNFIMANLYRTDTRTSLKTSLKTHIQTVRKSGLRDAIRLLKLWREKKAVPFKKSFLLEMMTILACKGLTTNSLEIQVITALEYIRDNILNCNVVDPANSNNSLSDDLGYADRMLIQQAAIRAIQANSWTSVFY